MYSCCITEDRDVDSKSESERRYIKKHEISVVKYSIKNKGPNDSIEKTRWLVRFKKADTVHEPLNGFELQA